MSEGRPRPRASIAPAFHDLGGALGELGDPGIIAWSAVLTVVVLVVLGTVTAIIPNPVFGRSLAPEPFAIATWLASAPLAGILGATYLAPTRAIPAAGMSATPLVAHSFTGRGDGSMPATLGGIGAFLAVGCPLCNKVALLLLGTSGTMALFAPLQPLIGLASVALLAGTLLWRLHLREQGAVCAVG